MDLTRGKRGKGFSKVVVAGGESHESHAEERADCVVPKHTVVVEEYERNNMLVTPPFSVACV